MKTNASIFLLCLLLWGEWAFAQRDIVYSYSIPIADAVTVSAWSEVPLHDQPGSNARRIAYIYYGEGVEKVGDEAFVMYEKRNFFKVRTKDGKVGWVDQEWFVEDGGIVVALERARIYKKPSTITTITDDYFEPGELVIFKDWQGDWVELVGKERRKSGWIKGTHLVSINETDIEVAKDIEEALADASASNRKYKLERIRQMRDGLSPDMEEVLDFQILNSRYYAGGNDTGLPPVTNQPIDPVYDYPPATPSPSGPTAGADTETAGSNMVVREVVDMDTGKSYQRVTESGGAYEVLGPKKPKNIYWAYHKTRPIGSKVLIHVPEDGGYIQVEVVNRLRKDNANVIGLGKDLLMAVYGTRYPTEIVISYPR